MGEILKATCPGCRHSVDLYEGGGMLGIEHITLDCRSCEELVDVPFGFARGTPEIYRREVELGRCPTCGGQELELAVWRERGEGRERTIECPKCREEMTLEFAGIWD